MDDAAPDSPPARRLFGWRILLPCLALSLLAFGAAAFYLGWSMGQKAARPSKSQLAQPLTQPASLLSLSSEPSAEEDDDSTGIIKRNAIETSWVDATHEVVAYESAAMTIDDAYPIGVTRDREHPGASVKVTNTDSGGDGPSLLISRSTAFSDVVVALRFFLNEHRVEATVASGYDVEPQPPPEWHDVNGSVAVSSWDWSQANPIVIAYELYGKRGGSWHCAHGKVVLAR